MPHSFAKYYGYRLQLQARMITDEMSLLWVTFDPSDLQCPIVFWLAGVSLPVSDAAALAFKTGPATINPVAIATFFDETCKAILITFLLHGLEGVGFSGLCQHISEMWRLIAEACSISIIWFGLKT